MEALVRPQLVTRVSLRCVASRVSSVFPKTHGMRLGLGGAQAVSLDRGLPEGPGTRL